MTSLLVEKYHGSCYISCRPIIGGLNFFCHFVVKLTMAVDNIVFRIINGAF